MKEFVFSYPTKVYFGEKVLKKALEEELSRQGHTVMLAYGGGSVKQNGIYDSVEKWLRDMGKRVVDFSGILPNPTYAKVQEGAALAKREHVDYILAVGGGSVIDCCKILAAQAKTEEDIWEMELVQHKLPVETIPLGAIVTASGTGAEMNGGAVITHEALQIKTGLLAAAPRFAVLDPTYTLSVPPMQVFSGAFDTFSHAMETYLGQSDADHVSDDVALAILRNTVVNMRRLLVRFDDVQARGNLMWDSAMAENGILKVGRLTDFQAHQIEHQLGAYTDCNHGQGLAVIQPAYYRHILQDAAEKFTRFAREVFGVDTAEDGIRALTDFLKECGLPTRLDELKFKVEITPKLLRQVADTCNLIQSNPRALSREEIYDILMECLPSADADGAKKKRRLYDRRDAAFGSPFDQPGVRRMGIRRRKERTGKNRFFWRHCPGKGRRFARKKPYPRAFGGGDIRKRPRLCLQKNQRVQTAGCRQKEAFPSAASLRKHCFFVSLFS